jgi:DNA-binding MarR family transcriptional regulator
MTNAVHSHTQIEHCETRNGEQNLKSGGGPQRKLTNPEIDSVLAMYREGEKTIAEIAEYFGISPSSVTVAAKRAG